MTDELLNDQDLAARLETIERENAELRRVATEATAANRKMKETAAIDEAVSEFKDWHDAKAAVKLLATNLKLDDDDRLNVFGDNGAPLAGPYGRLTVKEHIESFRQQNAWLLRTETGGDQSSQNAPKGPALAKLFGKNSHGASAQKLMAENPAEYRRLRAVAKEQGLI